VKSKRQQSRTTRDKQTLKDLGDRLKGLRAQRGLSQEQLAERAGLTAKFLGEVERVEANPSATTVARLADALSVDVGDLFDATDDILPVPAIQMDHLQEVYRLLGRAIAGLLAADGPPPTVPAPRPRKADRPRARSSRR
jgi:transcriptional regulator with XRE-family HTH domain